MIFHTAVLLYVDPEERGEFGNLVTTLCDFWIANETPGVMPHVALPPTKPTADWRYMLSVNGAAVAWAEPHGGALEWIADPPQAFRRH